MMESTEEWRVKLFRELRADLTPLYADKYENVQHAMCKARLQALLLQQGYKAKVEKPMPASDFIDLAYIHQFKVDVYGEYFPPGVGASITEPTDIVIFEVGGLDSYHSKSRYKPREKRKKEMICSQYGIKPERYFVVEKDEIYSKEYMLTDDALIDKFLLRHKE